MLAFVGTNTLLTDRALVKNLAPGLSLPATAHCLDCQGLPIEPGRVNAHTHIYSGLAPFGIPQPDPPAQNFVQILERLWWRLDRALDEASLRASARYYVAESLLRGTTCLIDHHESPNFIEGSLDVLADACQELGMRAVLCFGATERNGGRQEARRGLAECARFLASNRRPLVKGLVGLHASFTVSDETIVEAAELCRRYDTVMHVHLAEDGADVEDARRRGYAGPLERLERLGALPPGSILAHGVHLTAQQVARVEELGCWLIQNPRSNQGNRVGYAANLGYSRQVGLGSDGYPSDLSAEEALLEDLGEEPAQIKARAAGGWRLLEQLFKARFIPLEAGTVADVACLEDGRARHLCVDGRLVVENGQLLAADYATILCEARRQADRLFDAMLALPV